jgi:hypothetical protein
VKASTHYNLLTPGFECDSSTWKGKKTAAVAEWGYDFQAFAAKQQPTSDCINMTIPSLALHGIVPKDRAEALSFMNTYFDCRTAKVLADSGGPGSVGNNTQPKILNLIGHFFYASFGVQRGKTSVVASEIQENINSIQGHYAFTRGAARQYHIPWAIDVSPWWSGMITDYSNAPGQWGPASASGGDGGHSVSLFKRSWYTAYLSGANQLIIEGGGVNLFFSNYTDEGVLRLSPLGENAQGLKTFVDSFKERPIPYVPMAVVLEHAHGFGLSLVSSAPKTWGTFPLSGPEVVAWDLLNALWPNSWDIKTESNYLVGSPYGDSFDILAEHNFTQALPLYRVATLAGGVSLGADEVMALHEWATGGGTLVLFASQLSVDGTTLIGASLGEEVPIGQIHSVKDLETGWMNASSATAKIPPKPFCAPQKAGAVTGNFYIRVGGDGPNVHSGWGGGNKCCQSGPGACRWYGSRALCDASIATAVCEPCASCEAANDGCPTWACEGKSDGVLRLVSRMISSAALLEATLGNGSSTAISRPVAIRNTVGDGVVITILLEGAELLKSHGVLVSPAAITMKDSHVYRSDVTL